MNTPVIIELGRGKTVKNAVMIMAILYAMKIFEYTESRRFAEGESSEQLQSPY